MSLLLQGLLVACYLTLSAVIAFALPQTAAGIDERFALFAGVATLFLAALLHQGVRQALSGRETAALLRQILAMNQAAHGDVSELRRAITGLKDKAPTSNEDVLSLDSALEDGPADNLEGELRILKTLYSQLPRVAVKQPGGRIDPVLAESAEAPDWATPAARAAEAVEDSIELISRRAEVTGRSAYRMALVGDDLDPLRPSAPPVPTRPAMRNMSGPAADPVPSLRPEQLSMPAAEVPNMARLQRAGATAALSEDTIIEMTQEALERAQVSLFLQPIVTLPNRRVRYYETYSRIRATDGRLIGPEQYLDIATREGLIAAIDNNLLFRCVQLMRRLRGQDRRYGFFCNISPHTLRDQSFFPHFIDYLSEQNDFASELFFEFSHADIDQLYEECGTSLDKLARLGFRFSLDRVELGRLDLKTLASRNFTFVKVDSPNLLEVMRRPGGVTWVERLRGEAKRFGITPIVSKIESERDLVELLDIALPFGQGYLFGRPRESKPRS